jgi:hypothetical protein
MGVPDEEPTPEVESDLGKFSRREAVAYNGLGLALLKTPLQSGFLPDITPRLQYFWMQVQSDGETHFVAKFESNVDFVFLMPFVSRKKIE